MFPTDDQIEQEYFDKETAYWCGIIQGAGSRYRFDDIDSDRDMIKEN